MALREGTHHVQVDEGEPLVWDLHGAHPWVDCWRLFGHLARDAGSDELGDLVTHGWPVVVTGDPLGSFLDPRVIQMVCQLDDGAPLSFWDEGARFGRVRDLANNVDSIDGDLGNFDVSWHQSLEVSCHHWARLLCLCQVWHLE